MSRSLAEDLFWMAFALTALTLCGQGVNRINKQLFDIEAAIRLQTAQQTHLIERLKARQ